MRSSTIIVTFAGILIVALVWIIWGNISAANDPVMRAANTFLAGAVKQDATIIEPLIDPKAVKITKVGNKITSMEFAEFHGGSSFIHGKPAFLYNTDLSALAIDPSITKPFVTDDPPIATVGLTKDGKLYLRKINDAWKVFYLSRPDDNYKAGQQ